MNVNIRAVNLKDARDIYELRTMNGVKETILSISSERLSKAENFINNLGENDHTYVAEVENNEGKKIVGVCGLSIYRNPRLRHSGSLGIMVHKGYQGKGIGKMLLENVLNLADNWLMLVRIELGVLSYNQRAINLYKFFGFELEGTKKYAVITDGKYEDEYIMARYNYNVIK